MKSNILTRSLWDTTRDLKSYSCIPLVFITCGWWCSKAIENSWWYLHYLFYLFPMKYRIMSEFIRFRFRFYNPYFKNIFFKSNQRAFLNLPSNGSHHWIHKLQNWKFETSWGGSRQGSEHVFGVNLSLGLFSFWQCEFFPFSNPKNGCCSIA